MKRPFRGLRTEPEDFYDAAVIGAGIGGLVCANLLARQGRKVLLVEQHYMVGGYCSTFRRKGFTFDAGTHFYPLLGNPETMPGRILDKLGVRTGWVKMDPVDHFHFPDGTSFSVPADFETYLESLKREFPGEARAIEGFFEEVRQVYLHGLLEYFRWTSSPHLDSLRRESVREALDRHFADAKLKLLLTADCPHWGSRPSRTSYVFDSMLRLSYFLGNYYPQGGSQAFADDLARAFEEQGGHILMSTAAERVDIRQGMARAVDLTIGPRNPVARRVRTDVVVSNADLLQTVDRLVGKEHWPSPQREALHRLRPSFPCYLCHIGLQGFDPERLARAQGYYWDSWNPDSVGRDGLRFKLFVPTLYEPSLAKPDHQILIVQKVREIDYASIADWPVHKAAFQAWVDVRLKRMIPGIEKHIVVQMSATARTSAHFTRNLQGAMLGWEMAPDQLGDDRPGIATPIPNLFCVGHWTQPGGGITPVIVSAMKTARLVERLDRQAAVSANCPKGSRP